MRKKRRKSAPAVTRQRQRDPQVLTQLPEVVMSPAEWEDFCKALDAPPRPIRALSKLLTEASVLDRPRNDQSYG